MSKRFGGWRDDWWPTQRDLGGICALFVWLIIHQPAVLFSQNKPATNNQPTVLFSQNKSALATSHQPNEQAVDGQLPNTHSSKEVR
jgi:hypothetical protein